MITALLLSVLIFILYANNTLSSVKVYKKAINSFVLCWSFVLVTSSINPYDTHNINPSTYLICITFILSFSIGYLLIKQNIPKYKYEESYFTNLYNKILINKTFVIIQLFCITSLVFYANKYFTYIASATVADARTARFFSGAVFTSGFEIAIFNYLISSYLWFVKFLLAFGIAINRIRSFGWLSLLITTILYMGFGAGRIFAVEIFFILLFIQITLQQICKDYYPNLILHATTLLSMLFFTIILTAIRMADINQFNFDLLIRATYTLFEHFIIYFTGPLRAFEIALSNIDKYFWLSYGFLTLSSLDEIISYLLIFIGFDVKPYIWNVGILLNEEIYIGGQNTFNALYSVIYYFYFDFGYIGILLFGITLGFLTAYTIRAVLKNGDIGRFFIASLIFTISLSTILTWKLRSADLTIAIVSAILMIKFNRKKLINKNFPNQY